MLKKMILLLYRCSLLAVLAWPVAPFAGTLEIEFIYIGADDSPALIGARQGIAEANLQGKFLNQRYRLDVMKPADLPGQDLTDYLAILTDVDSATFRNIAGRFSAMPVFNLGNEDDTLRRACIANVLHIVPSARMKADALEQWRHKQPETKATARGWHHDFKKFAARDLNKRFKKRFKMNMDEKAWAGWAAVKMASDTVARTGLTTAAPILRYLKHDLGFDGQKGSNMNFRDTGQLRQLLLLVEADRIVAEAPVRGVAQPPGLDSLGLPDCK